MLIFIAGLLVGGMIGMAITALVVGGGRGDE